MVDAEIASLYDAVRSSRFADNTVIIFGADHGEGAGFHGNVSKGYLEEEAWRVPLAIVDPRADQTRGWWICSTLRPALTLRRLFATTHTFR